jgi:hypothetical protein
MDRYQHFLRTYCLNLVVEDGNSRFLEDRKYKSTEVYNIPSQRTVSSCSIIVYPDHVVLSFPMYNIELICFIVELPDCNDNKENQHGTHCWMHMS